MSRTDERGLSEPQASSAAVGAAHGSTAVRPIRSCRFCRSKHPKRDLTRWVHQSGAWVEDTAQRLSGRGVYTCSEACTAKLLQAGSRIR